MTQIETPEEREVFSAMEQSYVRKEGIRQMDKYQSIMEELAIARMLIRELGDRLAKLEKPVDNLDRMSKPNKRPLPSKWAGLTDEEKNNG
jgi:hypothetical protein